jgi:tetratricopeptide (TPR) repeat protein
MNMIKKLIANATADKKLAQAARKDGNYDRAIALIERAVKTLEAEKPKLAWVKKGVLSEENKSLAEALAEIYGSSGGIYRSAKEYAKSVKAYDEGCKIEQDERFAIVNSYNLTQRLVARVILEPKGWVKEGRVIDSETFPDCLRSAKTIVALQTQGPRKGDSWAWADLGMLLMLNGENSDMAWDSFIALEPKAFVFTSAISVLSDLLGRITDVAEEAGADPLLVATKVSLQETSDLLSEAAPEPI